MAGLKFSLKRKQCSVELEGEDGVLRSYLLRELTGTGRDHYLNLMSSKVKIDAEGKPSGIKDFSGLNASLLTLSLFDDAGKNVPEREIQNWPASVQMALFEQAKALSGLDPQAEPEAKND